MGRDTKDEGLAIELARDVLFKHKPDAEWDEVEAIRISNTPVFNVYFIKRPEVEGAYRQYLSVQVQVI